MSPHYPPSELALVNCNLSFPNKLFLLMENEQSCGVVAWCTHGFAFRILDMDKFVDEIVPKYFKHTKFTSFQRQLNLYGFRRVSRGEDQGAYFHPYFQRGRRDLLADIKRFPLKGSMHKLEDFLITLNPSARGDGRGAFSVPVVPNATFAASAATTSVCSSDASSVAGATAGGSVDEAERALDVVASMTRSASPEALEAQVYLSQATRGPASASGPRLEPVSGSGADFLAIVSRNTYFFPQTSCGSDTTRTGTEALSSGVVAAPLALRDPSLGLGLCGSGGVRMSKLTMNIGFHKIYEAQQRLRKQLTATA